MRQSRCELLIPTIHALSATSWEAAWLSRQQLLSRLARQGWPIVYSTGALSLWERNDSRWRRAGWRARIRMADGVQIYEAGRLPFLWQRFPVWDYVVTQWHARRLSRLADRRQWGRAIAYIWHPQYLPYLAGLRHDWLVYHATDINAKMPGYSPRIAAMEAELVERADLVIGASRTIIRHLPGSGPKRGQVLLSGSDAQFFCRSGPRACPADLAAIPRPRLGYVGNVNVKVDFNLIATIATARPDWSWVLVGPVSSEIIARNPTSREAYVKCRESPNVHFLGEKSYHELPAYEAHMDVNTLCYRIEESGWWIGVSPIKLYEYLAVGKPIVGSLLDAVRPYAGVVDLAANVTGWIDAIERALRMGGVGSTEQRRAVAAANSWDRRAELLERLLLEMIGAGAARPHTP